MNCIKCGNQLTEDMFLGGMCFNCGCPVSDSENAESTRNTEQEKLNFEEREKEKEASRRKLSEKIKCHKLTTGCSFDGYTVLEYKGLVSGESVIGAGLISTLESYITNTFGTETFGYSEKMKTIKKVALEDMIKESISLGGNGIIGISYSFSSFTSNMIGVSVNGTAVSIKPTKD